MGLVPLPSPTGVSAMDDVDDTQVHVAWVAMLPASHPDAAGELVVGVIGSLAKAYAVHRPVAVPPWGATVAPADWARQELGVGRRDAAGAAPGAAVDDDDDEAAAEVHRRAPGAEGAPPNASPLGLEDSLPARVGGNRMPGGGDPIGATPRLRAAARAFHRRTLAMHARGAASRAAASQRTTGTRGRGRHDPWAPWRTCVLDAVGRIQNATRGLRHAPRPLSGSRL